MPPSPMLCCIHATFELGESLLRTDLDLLDSCYTLSIVYFPVYFQLFYRAFILYV